MNWILSAPASRNIGHAQEAGIIRWKWYIWNRVKAGKSGVVRLHKLVMGGGQLGAGQLYSPVLRKSLISLSVGEWDILP